MVSVFRRRRAREPRPPAPQWVRVATAMHQPEAEMLASLLGQLDIPVLGLCGTEDPFPDQPQQLAGMRRFEEASAIPGAGRFVHWEQPGAFNRRIRQFIEERL